MGLCSWGWGCGFFGLVGSKEMKNVEECNIGIGLWNKVISLKVYC